MLTTSMIAASLAAAVIATAAGAATTSTQGSGFTIPDMVTRTSVITITDASTVSDVTFSLNGLTHSYMADLLGTLEHGGVTVMFLDMFGSRTDLGGTYVFSDAGAVTLAEGEGDPKVSGTYRTNMLLSAFDGMSAAGDWTLTIRDLVNGDTGNLNSWTLNLTTTVSAVPEPATWAMMIGGFGMVGGSMRRRQSVKSSVRLA